jgi:hypothetical protein
LGLRNLLKSRWVPIRAQRMTITTSHSDGFGPNLFTASCGVMAASIGIGAAGSSQLTTSNATEPRNRSGSEGNSSLSRRRAKARSSATSPGDERKTRIG